MAFKMKGSAFKLNNVATKSALKQTSPMKDSRKVYDFLNEKEAEAVNAHNRDHSMGIDHEKSPNKMKSALKQNMMNCPVCEEEIDERKMSAHMQTHRPGGGGKPPGDDAPQLPGE